ncbi:methyltransferase type 11 [Pelomyxa schiedti]|nr:methyltransferase type 11 [Pelomyxa schiedti]
MMVRRHHASHGYEHACPPWLGYVIDNRVRRWLTDSEGIVRGYASSGDVVMDFGCGHGMLSMLFARIVGKSGRVYAVDLQDKMLDYTRNRAAQEGHSDVVVTKSTNSSHAGTPMALQTIPNNSVNLVVFNWVLHELPPNYQKEVALILHDQLVKGGRVLVVEPPFHVPAAKFSEELRYFTDAGFKCSIQSPHRMQKIALLVKD